MAYAECIVTTQFIRERKRNQSILLKRTIRSQRKILSEKGRNAASTQHPGTIKVILNVCLSIITSNVVRLDYTVKRH